MAPPSKMAARSNKRNLRVDQGLSSKNPEDGVSNKNAKQNRANYLEVVPRSSTTNRQNPRSAAATWSFLLAAKNNATTAPENTGFFGLEAEMLSS
jgi:hypothetical protein